MAARNSSPSYKLRSLVTLLCRYRVVSGGSWRGHSTHHRGPPAYKIGRASFVDQGLRSLSITRAAIEPSRAKLAMEKEYESEEVQAKIASPPPFFGFSNWLKWLLGSIVTLLLPLWKNKWDILLTFEGKAEKVVEDVEVVAKVVEKVATTADNLLAEVAKQLPDNSELKEVVQVIEHVSSVAAQDARLIENIIHKAGDVKQDVEELEAMVEPIVDKIIQGKIHPKN